MGTSRVLTGVATAALSATILLTAAPPAIAAAEDDPVAILGPEVIKVTGGTGEDTAMGYLTIFNGGEKSVRPTVSFNASSDENLTAEHVAVSAIPPRKARRIGVEFSGLASLDAIASGQLLVTHGHFASAKSVEVEPGLQPAANWPVVLVAASFVVAACMGLVVATLIGDRQVLGRLAPGPKLTLESWATNFSAVGLVVGTVISQITYPALPKQISDSSLVSLFSLFLVLIAIAPFFYLALRKRDAGLVGEDEGFVGTNLTLLVACTVTFWAVLGEFGATTLLGWELIHGKVPHLILVLAALLLVLSAIRYFLVTTRKMAEKEWALPSPAPEPPPAAGLVSHQISLPETLDLSDFDSLRLWTADLSVPTVFSRPEEGEVELAVPRSTAAPKSHWSLL
jgi:hypothetical protein